jgi:cytochrome c oxidase assembly factor CtaG
MIQWWCSAAGTPWTWHWRPYPGVWLFMAAIIAWWVLSRRRAADADGSRAGRTSAFASGVVLLWLALDWPLGALAGYLASAHMAQFLIISLIGPPLLLLGSPGRDGHGPPSRIERIATHPLITLVVFNVIVIGTHVPAVTDALMPLQVGSFVIDLLWLGAGLLFWWPVIRPQAHPWFVPPVRMAYLFANMVLMTAPGAMITFSELPLYATYELAPPIPGVTPLDDQRFAGLNMRVGAALVSWIAISTLFLRWNRAEEALMAEEAAAAGIRSGEGRSDSPGSADG